MSSILQQPDAISLVGNMKEFIVSSAADVTFQLLEGATTVLSEVYSPDANGKVYISVDEVLKSLLSVIVPDGSTDVTEQPNAAKAYAADIDGTQVNFTVVKSGVDATVDPSVWLKANWLTWQPQTKYVKYTDPQWLSYFAVVDVTVKVKAYFIDNTTQTITFATLTAGKEYSLNVLFSNIRSKFTNQPTYFDIWTEDAGATRLSFIQRIVLENNYYEYNDVFVFENTLGGIDSVRMTGMLTEKDNFQYDQAEFTDEISNYDLEYTKGAEKNTGYIEDADTRKWIKEMLNSVQVYHLVEGELRKITISNNDQKADPAELNSYAFTFIYSIRTRYLNLSRADNPSEPIQVVSPTAELFFLVPRLLDYQVATLTNDLLFLVQSPYVQEWKRTSFGAILQALVSAIGSAGYITGGEVINYTEHVEKGTLENLPSRSVSIAFAKVFDTIPTPTHFKVYRWVDLLGNGYWSKQDVPFHFVNSQPVSVSGFSFLIDDTEDLTGVIVEYKFE